jgi:hypothetical protein
VDAFDADVLIYACVPGHVLGRRVLALFGDEPADAGSPAPGSPAPGSPPGQLAVPAGIGSVLLVPELLTKPLRDQAQAELVALSALLGRLDLRPVDEATAELAAALGAEHGLGATDAVHLATAINMGADRFLTNNRRDFPQRITDIAVTYPLDLPDPHEQSPTPKR